MINTAFCDMVDRHEIQEGRKNVYIGDRGYFHSYKPQYIEQEIWAKLIAYNITETMINGTVLETHDTKHEYKVNFTTAAHHYHYNSLKGRGCRNVTNALF